MKKISVSGWRESTDIELLPFLSHYKEKGITQTICTDISRDGMLQGAAVGVVQKSAASFSRFETYCQRWRGFVERH